MIETLSREELVALCRDRDFSEREILLAQLQVASRRALEAWDAEDEAIRKHAAAHDAQLAAGANAAFELWNELRRKAARAATEMFAARKRRERRWRRVQAIRDRLAQLKESESHG